MRSLLLLSVVVLLSGCYRSVVSTGARGDGQTRKGGGLSFIYGLTPVKTGAVECPYGLARAESWAAWYNFFLVPITGGLVSGIETEYECAAGPGPRR